jgi:arylsulfatase A-like enzyme
VSGPGVEPGVDDDFHYNVDLGPTVNEFVGADVSDGWDGQSFASSLESGDSNGRDHLVVSQGAWACQRAVRWGDYVLIRTFHDGLKNFAPVELYDVAADPHETTDLALDRPDVVREGLSILQDWTSARLQESATGVAGGQPHSDNALEDPLWRVMREGGPYHAKGFAEDYAERLRETGREDHAEKVETKRGVVSTSVAEYLANAE